MKLILSNRKFRLLWMTMAFNEIGYLMYLTVHGWLSLTLTGSAFWVGATYGMHGLGLMLFSIFAGVLADRLDRRKLAMSAQILQAIVAFILAILIFNENIELWHVLIAALLNGMAGAIKIPSQFALTLDIVGHEKLLPATASNFVAMTALGVVAPLIGGQIVENVGVSWVYLIMGVVYSSATLVLTRLTGVQRVNESTSTAFQDLIEGARYVFNTPTTRILIFMILVGEGFGWAHESMLPVMAEEVLDAGPSGLGYLLSAASAGALVSTLIVSSLGDIKYKGRLLIIGYAGFAIFLILFANSTWLPLSLILIATAYACVMIYEITISTVLQTAVPDNMRGRALSTQIFSWGVTGFSGFHMGAIAAWLNAPLAIMLGAGIVLLNAIRLARWVFNRNF